MADPWAVLAEHDMSVPDGIELKGVESAESSVNDVLLPRHRRFACRRRSES